MMRKHPKRLGNIRTWRRVKRLEVRKVLKEINDLNMGCAYTPAHDEISKAYALLTKAKELMSQKNWGK